MAARRRKPDPRQLQLFDWVPRPVDISTDGGLVAAVLQRLNAGQRPGAVGDLLGAKLLDLLQPVARALRGRGTLSTADLVQEAVRAIWKLLPRFDARRGTLKGWARVNGRRAMLRHIQRQRADVHLSDHAHQASRARTGRSRGASAALLELTRTPLSCVGLDSPSLDAHQSGRWPGWLP